MIENQKIPGVIQMSIRGLFILLVAMSLLVSCITVEVIPSPLPGATEISWSDWEGPGILYLKSGDPLLSTKNGHIAFSNFDGSQKSTFPYLLGFGPWIPDVSPETGLIVYEFANSLWVIDQELEAHNILSLEDWYVESPVIAVDGRKLAYSVAPGDEDIQQLWTINPDGTENALVIDDIDVYVTNGAPFHLRPIAWSMDNTKVYMVPTTDSDATPKGMYVADLATGTIEKALTLPVTLWDVSFSPDRTKIAYRTFQWIPVQNSRPEPGPPYTLNLTNLTTGETSILLESETDQYFHPIWSADGNHLAYSVRPGMLEADIGLFTINLATGVETKLISGSESNRLTPWYWLPEGGLVYTEGDLSSGDISNPFTTLYTIGVDGTDQRFIDSGEEITVLGVLND
jgi:hypothetical protein